MLFGIRGIEESTVYQGPSPLRRGRGQGPRAGERHAEEAREALLRLGRRKLGSPSGYVEAQIAALSDLDRLRELHDRVLDVSSWDELLPPPASPE